MQSFYVIEQNIVTRNQYYKVYVKEDELWFGKIGGQLFGAKQLYSKSLIIETLFHLVKFIWITPRVRKKELKLDKITEREHFLAKRGSFIVTLEQLSEVVINAIGNGSFKLKFINGQVKEFEFEEETNLEQAALIFYPIQVKHIDYFW
ncbi:hypothetical protein ABE61_20955 [Lysinibacillus sphaericus]|uniref:hypothetical protein n=1 Tax=Lysinibacillus sphaericus TaxID=1421 RepID=UPI0018CDB301|nr:hypothetical protein [Lysinibacillus sphaericus]MBG9456419.1 hypothetical protein [Lysinibacillus sphaericus]MBG9476493.1 hypothetical protein [Lysinibacillus sphaericus]MBG9594643.1 hypothetical protein [Lysinibacillus sphaericus]